MAALSALDIPFMAVPDNLTGCITCKAKRLKCDETKPTCQQCHKRGVECGGFKKDYKWRPFEEMSFTNKPAAPPRTKRGEFIRCEISRRNRVDNVSFSFFLCQERAYTRGS